MKTIPVKTAINKLCQQLGSDKVVAAKLGITPRWVAYLRKGEKKASYYLAKAIKEMAGER